MSPRAALSHACQRNTLSVHRKEIDIDHIEPGGRLAVRTAMLAVAGQRSTLLVRDDDALLGELDVVVLRREPGLVVLAIDSSLEDLAVLRAATMTLPTLDAPFADLGEAAAELATLVRRRHGIVPVTVPLRARTGVLVRVIGPDGRVFASFPAVVRYSIARDGARFAAIAVSKSQCERLGELASELRCDSAHEHFTKVA